MAVWRNGIASDYDIILSICDQEIAGSTPVSVKYIDISVFLLAFIQSCTYQLKVFG